MAPLTKAWIVAAGAANWFGENLAIRILQIHRMSVDLFK
jgi:hypothetical protein